MPPARPPRPRPPIASRGTPPGTPAPGTARRAVRMPRRRHALRAPRARHRRAPDDRAAGPTLPLVHPPGAGRSESPRRMPEERRVTAAPAGQHETVLTPDAERALEILREAD